MPDQPVDTPARPAASPRSGGLELYCYYRVPEHAAAEAQAEVESAHAALRTTLPGLQTRLLRRPETKDGLQTWMEIYRHPHGLDATQLAHIQREMAHRPAARTGPRHDELFVMLTGGDG